jgi:hypothetical protein
VLEEMDVIVGMEHSHFLIADQVWPLENQTKRQTDLHAEKKNARQKKLT